MVRQDAGKRLVAWVVPRGEAQPAELREHLRSRLPGYMVPEAFAWIGALPLNASGKVDRRALSRLPLTETEERGYLAPRTRTEELVAGILAEVLGEARTGGRVGALDSFFELGGHSLLAVQALARLREETGVQLPLRRLFEAPTVAELALAIDQLRAEGPEAASPAELPLLRPDPESRFEPFPLNDVQHAYWIGRGAGFELGNVATHSYVEFEVRGLDLARLEGALDRLVARHDMLRAVVLADGTQRVLPTVPPYRIGRLDLRGLPPAEEEERLTELRAWMEHRALPATQWPLFEIRASLRADGRVRLHVLSDALVFDARSNTIVYRELFELYADPDLRRPPLGVSFRDYVLAERSLQGTGLHRRSWEYWRARLDTFSPAPELPLRAASEQLEHPRFERRSGRLGRERWQALKRRGARAGLTPSGIVLAAFAETLAAWSKSPRFTINLTLFHRLPLHPQVDEIVGDFTSINLLEVDAAVPGPFELRARRVQERLWEDLDHRHAGGIAVLRELSRLRGRAGGALMPVVLSSLLTNEPGEAEEPEEPEREGGLQFVYGLSETSQVWLDHQVSESRGALVYNWDAVAELFPPGLLDDLFAAYGRLLERLGEEEAWTGTVSLLPPAHAELVARVNATAAEWPPGPRTLHGLFEAQARRTQERTAVVTPDRSLTYGELDTRSLALAHRLRELGAQPGRPVAVVMEKGWEQAVAVLAILRTGAPYLPADPGQPPARLFRLIERGEAAVALTQPWIAERLDWPQGLTVLTVEETFTPGARFPSPQRPADLAYVLFTSGSTGEPKGVMIDHQGAVNTILDLNGRYAVGEDDRILALSSLSFDLSVYDLFGLWAVGGAVVMPEPEALRDPARWLELLAGERVTVWNSVPALLGLLAERMDLVGVSADSGPVRLVLLSGDWIPVNLPERVRAFWPAADLISLGGATEASIWSISYPIREIDPAWTSIPYGFPLANQTFRVLGPDLEPRPVWVPGGLYIGGIGLALGYWRDPERTAASFVTHPRTGERLYRTGDLGRYLPDGNIEFLGREDAQVKIGGHRIELGEIEAVLARHPGVRVGVAAAVGPDRFHRRLVAYVVPQPAASAETVRTEGDRTGPVALPPVEPRRLAAAPSVAGTVPLARFGRLLAALAPVRFDDLPLPKYRYPSAGSLYPVQAYVQVSPGGVEGLEAGLYYHHPREHALVRLGDSAGLDAPFAIFLVARPSAIAPLYGDLWRDFSLLEAGYMADLLLATGMEEGIGLRPAVADFNSVALEEDQIPLVCLVGGKGETGEDLPSLAPPSIAIPEYRRLRTEIEILEFKASGPGVRRDLDDRPLISLPGRDLDDALRDRYLQRRTHREFTPAPVAAADLAALLAELPGGLRAGLYCKPGRVQGIGGGTWAYERAEHALVPLADGGGGFDRGLHAPDNQAAFEQSAFSLFLFQPPDGPERDRLLLLAGRAGQRLMTAAPARRLGLCPVGALDFDRVRDQLLQGGLLHSFVAGVPVGVSLSETERRALADGVLALLQRELPEYMVPDDVCVLDTLPLSANGKVDRSALPVPSRVASLSEEEAADHTPTSPLELQMVRLWEEVFGIRSISSRDSFFDLGGDSLLAVRLMARIRERFGRELPLALLYQEPTAEKLATALAADAVPGPSPLVEIQAGTDSDSGEPPMFCVHAADGGVFVYVPLAYHLGPSQPFFAFQGIGRDDDLIPRTVESLAEKYLAEIRRVRPHGPYRLGGWSYGGQVALEIARRLLGEGEEVEILAFFDTLGPAMMRSLPSPDDAQIIAGLSDLGLPPEDLRARGGVEEQLAYVVEKAQERGFLPQGYDPARLRHRFEVSKANILAGHHHVPAPYPGRIHLFATSPSMERAGGDPTLGWGGLALAGVEAIEVPGWHGTVLREPNVRVVAKKLREGLG